MPPIDAMLTIEPGWPAAIIDFATTCVVTSIERTLTSNVASQSSTVISSSGAMRRMPALLTRMSTPPSRPMASSVAARVDSGSARSMVIACAPNSAARRPQSSPSRSMSTSCAPSRWKASAIAAPMPRAAPVTSARRPSRRRRAGAVLSVTISWRIVRQSMCTKFTGGVNALFRDLAACGAGLEGPAQSPATTLPDRMTVRPDGPKATASRMEPAGSNTRSATSPGVTPATCRPSATRAAPLTE